VAAADLNFGENVQLHELPKFLENVNPRAKLELLADIMSFLWSKSVNLPIFNPK